MTVIINNLNELKEFTLICGFLEILRDKNYLINETLKSNNKETFFILPDKNEMKKRFGSFFYKEKNEFEKEVYSEINYYYISEKEKEIIKEKCFKVFDYTIYCDFKFDNKIY